MANMLTDSSSPRTLHCNVQIFALPGLTSREKLVYLVLKSYAKEQGSVVFPKNKTIARDASCSERQVIRITNNLVKCGLIRKIKRFNDDTGARIRNDYDLRPFDEYRPIRDASEAELEEAKLDEAENTNYDTVSCTPEKTGDSAHDTVSQNEKVSQCHGAHVKMSQQEQVYLNNKKHIPPIYPPQSEPEENQTQLFVNSEQEACPTQSEPKEKLEAEKPQASEEQPLELSAEKKPEKSKRSARKTAEEYTPEFEAFWAAYPTYGRRKKAAFDAWKRLLRLKAATPDELIHAARRYADMCRATCKEEQYTLHAASFLGPVKEAWRDYIGLEVQMGRELKDVDISRFRREDGSVDVKAFERARRGLR